MSNLTFLISQLAASSITLFVITRLNIKEGISNKNYDTSQIKKILPKKLKIWKNNSSLDYQLQSRFGIKLDKEIYFPYYCLFLVINYKKLGDNYYSYLNICGSEQIFEYYVEISKYEKELEKIIAKERFKFKYLDSFKDIYYFWKSYFIEHDCKVAYFYYSFELDWMSQISDYISDTEKKRILFLLLLSKGFNLDIKSVNDTKKWLNNKYDQLTKKGFISIIELFSRFLTKQELSEINNLLNMVNWQKENYLELIIIIAESTYCYNFDSYWRKEHSKYFVEKLPDFEVEYLSYTPKLYELVLQENANIV